MQPESGDATLWEDQFEVALQQQQPTLIVYRHYIASPPHNEREDIGHWQLQCLTASLNPHSKTGTANILQGGGLSKKC